MIEARGRFFERAADGTEVELGVVRVFEPPRKLVLDWYPGTGPSEPTHVEILLFPEGTGTRVQLFHKPGPERTFLVTPTTANTVEFSMEEVFDGLMAGVIGKSIPDLQPAFDEFAACLKARAEAADSA
jgi:uncharacterized protein YndB with AHSA1/START domain